MKWLLLILAFQSTAHAVYTPNWTPYQYPGFNRAQLGYGPSFAQNTPWYQPSPFFNNNQFYRPGLYNQSPHNQSLYNPSPYSPFMNAGVDPMSMYGHDELNPWAMNPLMMMNMARLGLTSPLYQRALRERERERERRQDRDDLDDEDEADARDKDCVSCRTSRHRRLPDRIAVRERTLERTQENDSHTESGSFESHSTPAPRARAQSDSDEVARVASVDQNYVPQKPARAATPPSGPLPLTVRSVPEDEPERPRSQRLTLFPWRNRDERLAQNAKVWKPFVEEFKICAPGCEPYHYDADEENKYHKDSPNSCHVVGHALDVGGMICGGRLHLASNRGEFERVVNCVENRYQRGIGKIKTIYHDPRFKGHGGYTHAHFSLTCNGGKNW